MKVLILGATGNLGQAVSKEFGPSHHCFPLTHQELDLRDTESFRRYLGESQAEVVINCAAWTAVDEAEKNENLVREVNGYAPGRVAAVCQELGVIFVQPSTDYVFDGQKDTPYLESDEPNPLNAYGRSKLLGEQEVQRCHPERHLILRTSWLFGAGRNFVRSLLARYRAGERRFRVVADQVGSPTYAPDLARVIRLALEKGLRGIYHACNRGQTSWFAFAQEIFRRAGLEEKTEVVAVSSQEFGAPALRPPYSVLDTAKLQAELGDCLPPYQDALQRFLAEENLV